MYIIIMTVTITITIRIISRKYRKRSIFCGEIRIRYIAVTRTDVIQGMLKILILSGLTYAFSEEDSNKNLRPSARAH